MHEQYQAMALAWHWLAPLQPVWQHTIVQQRRKVDGKGAALLLCKSQRLDRYRLQPTCANAMPSVRLNERDVRSLLVLGSAVLSMTVA